MGKKRIKNELNIENGKGQTVSTRSGLLNYLSSGVAGLQIKGMT